MMAENSQIPRHGYTSLREQIKQNLGGGLKVDTGPGPNQLLSHWLSAVTVLIQSLKKAGSSNIYPLMLQDSLPQTGQ